MQKNFNKVHVEKEGRIELHDQLKLTGAEVSLNTLPAGASVAFVHAHRQNEEIYAILEGKGEMHIDGEVIALQVGDWLQIAPKAKRQLFAAKECGIQYICIQVKANSLESFTMTDAIVY